MKRKLRKWILHSRHLIHSTHFLTICEVLKLASWTFLNPLQLGRLKSQQIGVVCIQSNVLETLTAQLKGVKYCSWDFFKFHPSVASSLALTVENLSGDFKCKLYVAYSNVKWRQNKLFRSKAVIKTRFLQKVFM